MSGEKGLSNEKNGRVSVMFGGIAIGVRSTLPEGESVLMRYVNPRTGSAKPTSDKG